MFISMSPTTSASNVSAFPSAQVPISTAVAATDSQDNSGADLSDAAKVYSAQQMIAAVTDAVTADPVTPGSMVDELV